MDDDAGFESQESHIAAAKAQLAEARSSGKPGIIGLAHLNLAATLAAVGDHDAAATEYASLISYLDLAHEDEEAHNQRWIRIASPSAPPPGAEDIDPVQLQTFARIRRADSLLHVGRRSEAAAELEAAAPHCRGFGKGRLRKQLNAVRKRMDAAADPATPGHEPSPTAPGSGQPATSLPEQIAAADELLGQARYSDAARVALRTIASCGEHEVGYRAQGRQVLGMALEAMGQTDDALAVLADSFTDYLNADQTVAAARIALPLAWRQWQSGQRDRAIALLRQALTFTESAGEPALRSQLLTDLGSLLHQQGSDNDARTAFEAARATAEAVPDRELAANARHGLAVVLASAGSADREDEVEALSLLEECRQAYEELGHPDRVAGCEHEIAALLGRLGSLAAARNRYQRALALYEALPEAERDTGTWPDEVADARRNINAIDSGDTAAPGLFASGGHSMSHRPD